MTEEKNVQAADCEENATGTPSYSSKEAEVARGKCIVSRWEDNTARCMEKAGRTEVSEGTRSVQLWMLTSCYNDNESLYDLVT